jgi:CelD/BcsL family acetyltransferase involved in cellulose biosynthesis
MRIDLISTAEIGPAERLEWRRLQAVEATVATPALSPAWAACVGAARSDARIAVIREGSGKVRGFLPIQAGKKGAVEPLAVSLNLGCGLVGDPQLEWGASDWLRTIEATAFPFQGAPDRQVEFARASRGGVMRLSAELQGGAAAYLRRKREENIDLLELRGRRVGALAANKGAPRVKLFSYEGADFSQTLYWSAEAYRRPQDDWEIAAVRLAFERSQEEGGCGALFTIHVEGELAAGAFFLTGERCAQLVFYGENPSLAPYEPAAAVISDAVAAFAARGIDEVDFGAVEGGIAREFSTRRRQRLYGLIRPAEKKGFSVGFAGRSRKADREWSRLGPASL